MPDRRPRRTPSLPTIQAADLFCGAGGTSTGLTRACRSLGVPLDLLAINHWNVAIATHRTNHPHGRHLCETLDAVSPRAVVPSGHLHLLMASPECLHHSRARGGRPKSDQSRASAWHVLRWAEALHIDTILIENVEEFREWGPLDHTGQPVKAQRGATFRAFLDALRSLGYAVEHCVLNAADYGDPTIRKRLFIQARRDGQPINWPTPTHAPSEACPTGRHPWRAARDIIDWSIPSRSIFHRARPLAPATMARIQYGLRKFGGAAAEPFLIVLRRHGNTISLDHPLPTITAGGNHIGLCEPFIVANNTHNRPKSIDESLPTVTTGNRLYLCEPFLVQYHGSHAGRRDGMQRVHRLTAPVPTLDTANRYGIVEPFLISYYGTGTPRSIDAPLGTLTTKDRFGLVTMDGTPARLDIRFRMLQPHELARGMSFEDKYVFAGTKGQQVKQIGNAVPVSLAEALCTTMLAGILRQRLAPFAA